MEEERLQLFQRVRDDLYFKIRAWMAEQRELERA
jgi:hypothetical protein